MSRPTCRSLSTTAPVSSTGLSPSMAGLSSPFGYRHGYPDQAPPISLAATLGISVDFFSCSYLDVSVRRVCLASLCIQDAMTLAGRVSPFGNRRIIACLPAPRRLSQATTSFIAGYRLGIHHVHLVTCPYNAGFPSLTGKRAIRYVPTAFLPLLPVLLSFYFCCLVTSDDTITSLLHRLRSTGQSDFLFTSLLPDF